MARANKLYEKPRVTSLATGDLFTIGQLQADGTYKVKTITRENARAELLAPVSVTYAELLALSGSYDTEVSYKITNATSAQFNLIVKAVSATQIGCDAKDPLYPNDVVKYNFASDVITWRWDTVNDISAGEDWRNSNNISIGAVGCSKISIGINCTVTIGNNCQDITIGNDAVATIPIGSTKINIGNGANFVNTFNSAMNNLTISDGSAVTSDVNLTAKTINTGCDISSSANKTTIANNIGVINYDNDDLAVFVYILSGAFVIVNV